MTQEPQLWSSSEWGKPPKPKPKGSSESMEGLWVAAARSFESICGVALQRGEVKSFEHVRRNIEGSMEESFASEVARPDKREMAKNFGLRSLNCLKILLGAASLASSFVPIPSTAANMTAAALTLVFDIPQSINNYIEALAQVFGEVSSALAQFEIYRSIDNADQLHIEQISSVLISFVKICAHVVRYRQGRRRDRIRQHVRSIFDDNTELMQEMATFRQALQQQRDVEGTITLAVAMDTQQNVARLLENSIRFGDMAKSTHQAVRDTQKGVQALQDVNDRNSALSNIRDTLGIPPTVSLDSNTTQTCTGLARKCSEGTGSWIWENEAYVSWTAPKGNDRPHILLLSGPESSGKTSASALITKRLEKQKGRVFVAHYFFSNSQKKSEEHKSSVEFALKYMAFQIARVDPSARKILGNACEAGPLESHRSRSLDVLWRDLRIRTPGSGGLYYFVFDGIEHLKRKQADRLLSFIFGPLTDGQNAGQIRVLVSGTDESFAQCSDAPARRWIRMEENNSSDMGIVIQEALNEKGLLQQQKPNPEHRRIRDKIVDKLPQNVGGSYSRMHVGLEDVMHLLSTRTAVQELDRALDQSPSHESSIGKLQRSLVPDEIGELNELLKWVLFSPKSVTLDELEGAMYLYSGTESFASLDFIIKNKYSALLKVQNEKVYGVDGVREYLQKRRDHKRASESSDQATISMNITINNVERELCAHFFWDLADKAVRDKFTFSFDSDASTAFHGNNSQGAIAADEFSAHYTIVKRAFEFLSNDYNEHTEVVGEYLVNYLPYHINCLLELEEDEKEELTPIEKRQIGQNLHMLLRDDVILKRHQKTFEKAYWQAEEIWGVQRWLMESGMTGLDKTWRSIVNRAQSPVTGYLRTLVKFVVTGFLRERDWGVEGAVNWIQEFIIATDAKKFQLAPRTAAAGAGNAGLDASSTSSSQAELNWSHVSIWCQGTLGLADSDLDSLWYERLAEASSFHGSEPAVTCSLYQQAIKHENPSWKCHRGLAETYFSFHPKQTSEAITNVEKALEVIKLGDATPEPTAGDIDDLYLRLGEYCYAAGSLRRSCDNYLLACRSLDPTVASKGHLGHLKAMLGLSDADDVRQLLNATLAQKWGETRLANTLKMMARDPEHDLLVLKLFSMVRGDDPSLLHDLMGAMRTATGIAGPDEDGQITVMEARGVLLYDMGVLAHRYKVSRDDGDPIIDGVRLWNESRRQLTRIGGSRAFVARQKATTALALHYFENMVDGQHQEHLDALKALADDDFDAMTGDPTGLLGGLYALWDEKKLAGEVLRPRVRLALQYLSDGIPESDRFGFGILYNTLLLNQDFENAAIAMSFRGQPDLVTDALRAEVKSFGNFCSGTDGQRQRELGLITKLAAETIHYTKTQVPDASEQARRIEVAKAYVDDLVATAETGIEQPAAESDSTGDSEEKHPGGAHDGAEKDGSIPAALAHNAYRSLQSCLQNLLLSAQSESQSTPNPPLDTWRCDGNDVHGAPCANLADWENEFCLCIYCSYRKFCRGCLAHLRDTESDVKINSCSARHRWLQIPPQGDDAYVGPFAERVRVPRRVAAVGGDEQVIAAQYTEAAGDGDEMTVYSWKKRVADGWGISLKEIQDEMLITGTPYGRETDESGREEVEGLDRTQSFQVQL